MVELIFLATKKTIKRAAILINTELPKIIRITVFLTCIAAFPSLTEITYQGSE
jgi:hypothetical protein